MKGKAAHQQHRRHRAEVVAHLAILTMRLLLVSAMKMLPNSLLASAASWV